MSDVVIKAEVAGRICMLAVAVGETVKEGDDIAIVEAMKMEIPQSSPASGKIKSILVAVDDVVGEGQALLQQSLATVDVAEKGLRFSPPGHFWIQVRAGEILLAGQTRFLRRTDARRHPERHAARQYPSVGPASL